MKKILFFSLMSLMMSFSVFIPISAQSIYSELNKNTRGIQSFDGPYANINGWWRNSKRTDSPRNHIGLDAPYPFTWNGIAASINPGENYNFLVHLENAIMPGDSVKVIIHTKNMFDWFGIPTNLNLNLNEFNIQESFVDSIIFERTFYSNQITGVLSIDITSDENNVLWSDMLIDSVSVIVNRSIDEVRILPIYLESITSGNCDSYIDVNDFAPLEYIDRYIQKDGIQWNSDTLSGVGQYLINYVLDDGSSYMQETFIRTGYIWDQEIDTIYVCKDPNSVWIDLQVEDSINDVVISSPFESRFNYSTDVDWIKYAFNYEEDYWFPSNSQNNSIRFSKYLGDTLRMITRKNGGDCGDQEYALVILEEKPVISTSVERSGCSDSVTVSILQTDTLATVQTVLVTNGVGNIVFTGSSLPAVFNYPATTADTLTVSVFNGSVCSTDAIIAIKPIGNVAFNPTITIDSTGCGSSFIAVTDQQWLVSFDTTSFARQKTKSFASSDSVVVFGLDSCRGVLDSVTIWVPVRELPNIVVIDESDILSAKGYLQDSSLITNPRWVIDGMSYSGASIESDSAIRGWVFAEHPLSGCLDSAQFSFARARVVVRTDTIIVNQTTIVYVRDTTHYPLSYDTTMTAIGERCLTVKSADSIVYQDCRAPDTVTLVQVICPRSFNENRDVLVKEECGITYLSIMNPGGRVWIDGVESNFGVYNSSTTVHVTVEDSCRNDFVDFDLLIEVRQVEPILTLVTDSTITISNYGSYDSMFVNGSVMTGAVVSYSDTIRNQFTFAGFFDGCPAPKEVFTHKRRVRVDTTVRTVTRYPIIEFDSTRINDSTWRILAYGDDSLFKQWVVSLPIARDVVIELDTLPVTFSHFVSDDSIKVIAYVDGEPYETYVQASPVKIVEYDFVFTADEDSLTATILSEGNVVADSSVKIPTRYPDLALDSSNVSNGIWVRGLADSIPFDSTFIPFEEIRREILDTVKVKLYDSTVVVEITSFSQDCGCEGEVKAFPNPTTGMLTVVDCDKILSISVYNDIGQDLTNMVPSEKILSYDNQNKGYQIEMNLSRLAKGLYILYVTTSNEVKPYKIILE